MTTQIANISGASHAGRVVSHTFTPMATARPLSFHNVKDDPMGKLPSFQFYPGDWRKDPDLQRCSLFAKGLLVEILCLMHESAHRGKLCEDDGITPWGDQDIIIAASGGNCGAEALVELEAKNVLKRDENGVLYSSRMVRDDKTREERARAGARGGLVKAKQNTSKQPSKTPSKREAKASSSSSSSSSEVQSASSEITKSIRTAVVDLWYPSGVAQGEVEAVDCLTDGFSAKGATPESIRLKRDRYASEWPKVACTAAAVLKHWDLFPDEALASAPRYPRRTCKNEKCKYVGQQRETTSGSCTGCMTEYEPRPKLA